MSCLVTERKVAIYEKTGVCEGCFSKKSPLLTEIGELIKPGCRFVIIPTNLRIFVRISLQICNIIQLIEQD
jgi:hypothetical protein